jgi:membrane-associated phospholipid phosphatase
MDQLEHLLAPWMNASAGTLEDGLPYVGLRNLGVHDRAFWAGLARLCGPLMAAAAFFVLWPAFDLGVEHFFYIGSGRFLMHGALANSARRVGIYLPLVVLAVLLFAGIVRALGLGWRWAPSVRTMVFLALSMALGPGLLVNAVLKDHAHRPRPVQVKEFGGKSDFRPFYRFDGACYRNCSFVSGETSAAVWLVAPAMLAPAASQPLAIGAALAFGLVVGLLRMGFGHHFPSDVVFAALLTLLVIRCCHGLLFGWRARSRVKPAHGALRPPAPSL